MCGKDSVQCVSMANYSLNKLILKLIPQDTVKGQKVKLILELR